ncbi:MAG TPA: BamA/TamA family outer membrane protein [Opitutaceae bacterium]|nr:BamA/TamA family outer membrane protein [Opitutaceae bacterium]
MRRALGAALAVLLLGAGLYAADPPRAAVEIRGLGWWRDHTLRGTLLLLLGTQRGRTIGASGIEDGAMVLYSTLNLQGYLSAKIQARVTAADGKVATYSLDPTLQVPLPRTLAAARLTYEVRRGRRYTVGDVAFPGLTALKPDRARSYFRGEGALAFLTAERAYSPGGLRRSEANLLEALRGLGYAEARVESAVPQIDPKTHVARLVITVHQGPLWRVAAFTVALSGPGPAPPELETPRYGLPWSELWRHEAETDLRRWYYQQGYPDVAVVVAPAADPALDGVRRVSARAQVRPGTRVRLGAVRFEGNTRTREAVLRPLVKAKPGGPLDRLQIQNGEYRISRLGVFARVGVRYEPAQGPVRDAVYELQEGKRQDVDILGGWGSYDQLRGGVEWRQYDLWGLGHTGLFRLIQSFKSSQVEYDYSVPELFGTPTDLTDKLFGFRRTERSFVDEQYGNTVSTSTGLPGIAAELQTAYTFVRLHASSNTLASVLSQVANANATSAQVGLTRDRRDNPLYPRQGYKVSVQLEEASRWLGGQVDFQRFQLAASYHTPWGRSRWIHLGINHQALTTFAANPAQQLPPAVFFYPGGEDSIRGYSLGQAAPRDPATGAYVPAVSATLINAELEQALTSKLSAVVFSDTLGATPTLGHYPADYWLYTLGVGLRYRTLIGPVRLEYGRNLNPRQHDPAGTVQFSVGFPF